MEQSQEQKAIEKANSIYIDGCFDLCHCGHFNAIRQASLLNERLVVGVNSETEIIAVKGPPILNAEERCAIIESCKWVTKIEPDTPYTPSAEVLDSYNCEYYAHGDDPAINAEGVDICEMLRKINRFKEIKRTTGVSTTDITGRMLRIVLKDQLPASVKEAPRQKFL